MAGSARIPPLAARNAEITFKIFDMVPAAMNKFANKPFVIDTRLGALPIAVPDTYFQSKSQAMNYKGAARLFEESQEPRFAPKNVPAYRSDYFLNHMVVSAPCLAARGANRISSALASAATEEQPPDERHLILAPVNTERLKSAQLGLADALDAKTKVEPLQSPQPSNSVKVNTQPDSAEEVLKSYDQKWDPSKVKVELRKNDDNTYVWVCDFSDVLCIPRRTVRFSRYTLRPSMEFHSPGAGIRSRISELSKLRKGN